MSKQTNRVDSAERKPTGFLTGAILRIRESAPLWPANVAAAIMSLELEDDPSMVHEMVDVGLFPESCRETVRPIDVYRMRQKFGARIGVSQRATLRSRDVKIIN
jgi:hypothetical protein